MKYFRIFLILTTLSFLMGCAEGKSDQNEPAAEPVPPEKDTLHFLGRGSVRIDTSEGLVIYIDPYAGKQRDYEKAADLVLVTHQHSDHNKLSLVKMKDGGSIIQCPKDVKSGDLVESHGISIQAVDAYNKNHKKDECCGFILTKGDLVVYLSGDTSTTGEMTEFTKYGIDYAVLCMDGYYNMGPEEAMDVAGLIGARHVIPVHTAPSGDYSRENMDAFTLENKIDLAPGEFTVLDSE